MNALKKIFPLIISFLVGVVITYLYMSLQQTKNDLVDTLEQLIQKEKKAEGLPTEEKHWMDVMIEKQTKETQTRIQDQQALGDDLKDKFMQFAE